MSERDKQSRSLRAVALIAVAWTMLFASGPVTTWLLRPLCPDGGLYLEGGCIEDSTFFYARFALLLFVWITFWSLHVTAAKPWRWPAMTAAPVLATVVFWLVTMAMDGGDRAIRSTPVVETRPELESDPTPRLRLGP